MLMIELNKSINGMQTGDILEFFCNDQMSYHDIPLWCKRTGNDMLEQTKTSGVFRYLVIKGECRKAKKHPRDFSRY